MQATPINAASWQGQAQLVFGVRAGKTLPIQSYAKAPLKLQKPLYPESTAVCHSILVHTAGGMVGGDELAITVQMESDSHALITTAAANKVYRSQGSLTHQTVELTLAANTILEWFPQETIIFNGALYQQKTRINLDPGALWMGWDISRFGRSARGETFQAGHWRSHLEVWQAETPLWIDRQFLLGGSDSLTNPHGLAGYPVVGTLALVGCVVDAADVTVARQLWQPNQPGEMGVTRLQQGMLCRYRGPSSQAARQWFGAIWRQLRPRYLKQEACFPRVWSL